MSKLNVQEISVVKYYDIARSHSKSSLGDIQLMRSFSHIEKVDYKIHQIDKENHRKEHHVNVYYPEDYVKEKYIDK